MVAFGVSAVAVSAVFALVTWSLASQYLLRQREQSTLIQATSNARVVDLAVSEKDPTLPQLLTGLVSTPDSAVFVRLGGGWLSSAHAVDRVEPAELPRGVLDAVHNGATARQRVTIDGAPVMVVGLPMRRVAGHYLQVFPLRELDRTYRFLSSTLLLGTVMTGLLGALVGRWVSSRALRPLTELNDAAARVAAGNLAVRLPIGDDPDLAPLARTFNGTTESLQRRVERDARFAGDVSHELRSPVTTMVNALSVLQARRAELPPTAQQAVDLLVTDLTRFRSTVDDLLEISTVDQGRSELHCERLDLVDLVEQSTRSVRGELRVEHSGARPQVLADRRRLERVIVNLVDNAEPHGGGLVRLAVSGGEGRARVEVDDAGPGVRAVDRERVFERFARGSAARRELDDAGSGLGLALAAQHVSLHGGELWVQDRPGGGARFVVQLAQAHAGQHVDAAEGSQ